VAGHLREDGILVGLIGDLGQPRFTDSTATPANVGLGCDLKALRYPQPLHPKQLSSGSHGDHALVSFLPRHAGIDEEVLELGLRRWPIGRNRSPGCQCRKMTFGPTRSASNDSC